MIEFVHTVQRTHKKSELKVSKYYTKGFMFDQLIYCLSFDEQITISELFIFKRTEHFDSP